MTDEKFRVGRTNVLRALLELPSLYRLAPLAVRWEERARANLRAELAAHKHSPPVAEHDLDRIARCCGRR